MSSKLLVDIPGNWVTTFFLEQGKLYTVGRGGQASIRLPDPRIAPVHAEFGEGQECWTVRDLSAGLGTHVNSKPVDHFPLADGDIVRVGNIDIVYQCPAQRATEEAWARTQQLVEKQRAALSNVLRKPDSAKVPELEKAIQSQSESGEAMPAVQRVVGADLEADDLVWVAQELLAILKEALDHPGAADEVYTHMLSRLRDSIGADNGFVMIPDENRRRWVIRAWVGQHDDWTNYEKSHPVPLTVANRAYETMKMVSNALDVFDDDSVEVVGPDESKSMQIMNVNCYVAVPLVRNQERRGVLYFDTRQSIKMFKAREVRLLQQAGNYILDIERNRV